MPRPRAAASPIPVTVALLIAAATGAAGARQAVPQVTSQGRPAQQTPAMPAVQQRGTSAITITVVTEEGAAVKNARVNVVAVSALPSGQSATPGGQSSGSGQPLQSQVQITEAQAITLAVRDGVRAAVVQRQSRTSSGGTAAFTELPAGLYSVIVAAPPGYVSRDQVPRLDVKAGGHATATLRMSRGGVVTGRVVDEDGDPVTGAWVTVLRATRGGRAQIFSSSAQATNDLGVYRVWSLPAGDYYVSANLDDRQAQPEDGAPQDGYLPTYHPGVAAFDAARSVQVKAGQESAGADIPLVRGRLGSVVARVVDSTGSSPGPSGPSGSIYLVARSRNPAFNMRGASMRPDGTYLIANVPAGEYFLSAMVSRGSGPGVTREGGFVPISVNGEEVSASLQTNTGATISGRVVTEGMPPAQVGTPGATNRPAAVRVTARTAAPDGVYSSAFSGGDSGPNSGTVRADGTFTITGVRGPVQIGASGGRAALKAVRHGASDIGGQPMELLGTERIDNLVVVMTYDTGSLQGSVVGEDDEPVSGATVLVVPDDADQWQTGSPFVRVSQARGAGPGMAGAAGAASAAAPGVITANQRSAADGGGFQQPQLPAGRYLVIAVADTVPLGTLDRQLIEQWRADGKMVTVDAGQTATVKVKAIK
jgi:hypothetical protein